MFTRVVLFMARTCDDEQTHQLPGSRAHADKGLLYHPEDPFPVTAEGGLGIEEIVVSAVANRVPSLSVW